MPIGMSGPREKEIKRPWTMGVESQRSRSREAENRFEGLAEASSPALFSGRKVPALACREVAYP